MITHVSNECESSCLLLSDWILNTWYTKLESGATCRNIACSETIVDRDRFLSHVNYTIRCSWEATKAPALTLRERTISYVDVTGIAYHDVTTSWDIVLRSYAKEVTSGGVSYQARRSDLGSQCAIL